jgi:hypothetical protein
MQPQKNNTDHVQLLHKCNIQTILRHYQGELDNVVVQQTSEFWSQYGTGLREEHKETMVS